MRSKGLTRRAMLLGGVPALFAPLAFAGGRSRKPNIILIYADDLG
jgi:hypothetical protein